MFRAHVLIIKRSKLNYTASGIITPTDVMIPDLQLKMADLSVGAGIITPTGVMIPEAV